MDMIERVARAICTAGSDEPGICWRDDDCVEQVCAQSCVGCRNVARAAIAALREPTPEMIAAITALPVVKQIDSMAVLAVNHGCEGLPTDPTAAVQIWNAGIDRILEE